MKVNVGFLVAYDYGLLKETIPLVYEGADKIVLALDKNFKTWSGNLFKVDASFFKWIEEFDTKKKIEWFRDDFYVLTQTAMQNEIRERHMMADFMGEGVCLQLDADEYMLDFDGMVKFLKKNEKKLNGNRRIQICGYQTTVYKKTEEGYFFVNDVTPFYLGTNSPDYMVGRKNRGQQKWYIPFQIIHLSWGRTREELLQKATNWGHNNDFKVKDFLKKWDTVNKTNYKNFDEGFHPFNKKYWKDLVYIEGRNINKVISEGSFPNMIPIKKILLKNFAQTMKFLLHRNNIRNKCIRKGGEEKKNKTIVFFNKYIPEYDKGSGANRFNELVKILIHDGCNVVMVTKRISNNEKYLKHYENLGVKVFSPMIENKTFTKKLKRNISEANLIWFYGPNAFKSFYQKGKRIFPNAKIIYDMIDVHHLRFQRAYDLDNSNTYCKKRVVKYRRLELKCCKKADIVLTISDKEKIYMTQFVKEEKLKVLSNIHSPKIDYNSLNLFGLRKDIVFIGSDHDPNTDALKYLHDDIMPMVWEKNPNIKVHVIGKVNVKASFITDKRFLLHGYVEEVSEIFNSVKMMVVPLRYGAGVKGKLGHAFEYALPVVSTRVGSEGMFLKNNKTVLKADSAEEFAELILKLYNDEKLWKDLSASTEESLKPFGTDKVKEIIGSL